MLERTLQVYLKTFTNREIEQRIWLLWDRKCIRLNLVAKMQYIVCTSDIWWHSIDIRVTCQTAVTDVDKRLKVPYYENAVLWTRSDCDSLSHSQAIHCEASEHQASHQLVHQNSHPSWMQSVFSQLIHPKNTNYVELFYLVSMKMEC